MTDIPNMDDPLDLAAAWKAAKAYDRATDAEYVGEDFTKAYAHLAHAAARHLYAALREREALFQQRNEAMDELAAMRERYIKAETRARRLEGLETAAREWLKEMSGLDGDPSEVFTNPTEFDLWVAIINTPTVEVRGERGPEVQVPPGSGAVMTTPPPQHAEVTR